VEGSFHGLQKILSWHLPVVTEKTTKKSVSNVNASAEIRTGHISNTKCPGVEWIHLAQDEVR
jgi:hypothetical protein